MAAVSKWSALVMKIFDVQNTLALFWEIVDKFAEFVMKLFYRGNTLAH